MWSFLLVNIICSLQFLSNRFLVGIVCARSFDCRTHACRLFEVFFKVFSSIKLSNRFPKVRSWYFLIMQHFITSRQRFCIFFCLMWTSFLLKFFRQLIVSYIFYSLQSFGKTQKNNCPIGRSVYFKKTMSIVGFYSTYHYGSDRSMSGCHIYNILRKASYTLFAEFCGTLSKTLK